MHEKTRRVQEDIVGKYVSVILDGTTHVCEAMVLIFRFMNDEWEKQRVCCLMLLAKSMIGDEVARQLTSVL